MPSDYALIRVDNQREYGAGVGRWGQDLLTNRYDDRAHFIFELLQNAEDALARRPGWKGSRAVTFTLSETALRIVHCGKLFDGDDVRGICGIAESTKDLTAIGRFGIGFKSVYAFTNRPEVHSGREDFAIESFVWPTAIPTIDRRADETVFILPLDAIDAAAHAEIAEGLRRLGPRTLLFLRQIEEIAWNVDGGPSGIYVRDKPEHIGENVRRIVLLGEEHGKPDVEETWLVFSREAKTDEGEVAGHVEVAFAITLAADGGRFSVQSVTDSRLVVFFPTVLPTHLGFLVQGPYRTTPSRDNVPRNDMWNQHLADETATLLVEALHSLRKQGLLDVDALESLPLDDAKFPEGSMFKALFQTAREALRMEPLLPAHGGGHVAASAAKLARTQELRELFDARQLANVFGANGEMVWLSGDITQDRTPELRQYLIRELDITEITPETILPKLNHAFLSAQPDDWIRALYEFLNGQPALLRQGRLGSMPLIRLEDGSHVAATMNGEPQAFLTGSVETGFPTVRRRVSNTVESRAFLQTLGLTEPDPVDDVVRNVLSRYRHDKIDIDDADYEADMRRILAAFATDSKGQREKLIVALRESVFVMAVDAGDGSKSVAKPGDLYLATERLKNLFAGMAGVLLVDDDYSCLRGEDVRELLEACGATRYLQPIRVSSRFSWQELKEMRTRAGAANNTGPDIVEDFTLRGLHKLLMTEPGLDAQRAATKAALLWEALCDVEDRRGTSAFVGSYKWFYFHQRSCVFDAAFVQQLNATAWIPDANGNLQQPEFVVFDSLGWKLNPFLLSKIRFKPPIIDQLAKEAGIDPGVLDLLKKLGVTSESELRDRLGLKDEPTAAGDGSGDNVEDALRKLLGDVPAPTPPVPDPAGGEPSGLGNGRSGSGHGTEAGAGSGSGKNAGERGYGQGGRRADGAGTGSAKRTPGGVGGRPFISYVAAQPDEEDPDSDGLDQAARMALEAQAINLILAREPKWQRTPTHNPGYDLFEPGEDAMPARWCEVKAMTGSLRDRPVGISRTQFDCAQKRGDAYWLYVVERAGETDARIVRIQDPAGKARTFTFDRGWLDIADVDDEQEYRED
jgi:hypothetical protein